MIKVSLPIFNAPECYGGVCHVHSETESVLGVMQLDVSYAHIEESLTRSHKNLIALSVLIVLTISLIILMLIRQWVVNPVRDLLEGTRRVADGELGCVIPVGEAELGALALAFNKMQQELLSSQRQLVTAEKLASIGKLAASVAHEINNPLTGILTFAEDLVDEAEAEDPRLADYQIIRREAMRCREIVRQLLDFSRQDQPSMRSVDMNEVLSHMVAFVSKQAVFRNIEIGMDLQEGLPCVTADQTQLEQVMLGLLVNASEAMPDGGKIFVGSASLAATREVEVSVQDTGPGISPENIQQIFEPFFSTKGGKSLGIGLAVSWSIVSRHSGRLEVDSKPGEGATFRIIMPEGKTVSTTDAEAT
ncbi:MAG: HAMP domain-containing protein [Candidatus Abyssubacteria bacterium]|nr:HAMP domain-containing protein [Candidatus Abyssubacteria bacterium]